LDERPDEDLVAASRHGDRTAYATLLRRHAKRVYAVCLGILGGVSDSEDIAQEAFVKGMTGIWALRDGNQFGSWICQIARNLCRDHLRRQSRYRELLNRQSAERELNRSDFSDLHAALAGLPEKYRLPLMLFYFDGKTTEKLAQELDLSQAGACTRLSRARKELRKLLSKQAGAK